MAEHPRLPDYGGPCLTNVVPALVDPAADVPGWMPDPIRDAEQVVLLTIDGLGWEQLQDRAHLAPTLSAMAGRPITTVVPTTTATALTSLTTGTPPGEHGVVGYRMAVGGEVLNVLRWSTPGGDARATIAPAGVQGVVPFAAQYPPVVTRAEFLESGFTLAHLASTRLVPYRMPSTLLAELVRLVRAGEPFVYGYYEGIDKVAHEYGLDDHYDAELVAVDRMVEALLDGLPAGVAVVLTSDHGMVEVTEPAVRPADEVLDLVRLQSGEARFRWLHARGGQVDDLREAAEHHHGDVAWVRTVDQIVEDGWFGPTVRDEARARLGDVALVAREPVAFDDPADTGPFTLIGRHGSMTGAEMDVPLLATRA